MHPLETRMQCHTGLFALYWRCFRRLAWLRWPGCRWCCRQVEIIPPNISSAQQPSGGRLLSSLPPDQTPGRGAAAAQYLLCGDSAVLSIFNCLWSQDQFLATAGGESNGDILLTWRGHWHLYEEYLKINESVNNNNHQISKFDQLGELY